MALGEIRYQARAAHIKVKRVQVARAKKKAARAAAAAKKRQDELAELEAAQKEERDLKEGVKAAKGKLKAHRKQRRGRK
jgi:hypothetical protein